MSGVDEKFDEFLKGIRETELKNEAKTIPDVFGIQYKEVYITKWIAYLLRQKYFGCEILNSLLSISGSDIKIEENDIDKVYTEFIFDTGRRIDILIFTKHYLVGIENKIWSGEQENQTADYQESMKELSSDKECIGIYLHPEQNRSESNKFKNVTYTELYDELSKINISDYPESFEKMMFEQLMFEQFMKYIKECLYLNDEVYPEMSENSKLFSIYSDKILWIEEVYRAEAVKMIAWIRFRLVEKGLIPIGDPKAKTYWQIVKNEKWKDIGFHFELVWEGFLIKKGKLGLDAHLENVNGTIAFELRNLMGISDEKEHGAKAPLAHKEIDCDFSTKQDAEETVKRIIEATKEGKFAEYAQKADEYIRNYHEGKLTE